MMKIQLLGTKDKTDFTLYLAHTIASQDKRVLIADSSKSARFYNGIANVESNEHIYEVQGVEVVLNVQSLGDLEKALKVEQEQLEHYDCLIVDMDDVETLEQDWCQFDRTLYISDNDRFNINKDVQLLHRYVDNTGVRTLRRVHFESIYNIPSGYIELKMNNRIEFSPDSFELEYDEKIEELRIMLQHNQIIPYKHLTKNYKRALTDLVVEWFELLPKDVEKHAKPSFFSRFKKNDVATHN